MIPVPVLLTGISYRSVLLHAKNGVFSKPSNISPFAIVSSAAFNRLLSRRPPRVSQKMRNVTLDDLYACLMGDSRSANIQIGNSTILTLGSLLASACSEASLTARVHRDEL